MPPSNPSHYFSRQSVSVPKNPPQAAPMRLGGTKLQLATGSGVFAKSGLDAGSRLLLETASPSIKVLSKPARVCDLGCGWGAIGCFLAARYPEVSVLICDINARAVWLAKHNAEQNRLQNIYAWCGDGLMSASDASLDVVACNPPIRAGNAVMAELFSGVHRCLKPGGELWAVIRTAQGARSWQKRLEELFGNCETVIIKNGYRILKSTK